MINFTETRAKLAGLMTALTLISWPACAFAQTTDGSTSSNTTTQNLEGKGNLAVTNALKCTTLNQMKSDDTPVDIYSAFADCIRQTRYQEATQLFMLAGAYGSFDVLRVSDVTAHDAKTVLVMDSMAKIDPAKKAAWMETLKVYMAGSGLADSCAGIRRLGPPSYYPTYMVQHGMAALTGNNSSPLVSPFDVAAAWQTVMTTYLQCPA